MAKMSWQLFQEQKENERWQERDRTFWEKSNYSNTFPCVCISYLPGKRETPGNQSDAHRQSSVLEAGLILIARWAVLQLYLNNLTEWKRQAGALLVWKDEKTQAHFIIFSINKITVQSTEYQTSPFLANMKDCPSLPTAFHFRLPFL